MVRVKLRRTARVWAHTVVDPDSAGVVSVDGADANGKMEGRGGAEADDAGSGGRATTA
jgi:hypothetical protein